MKSVLIFGIVIVASIAIGLFVGMNMNDKKEQREFNAAIDERNHLIAQINDDNAKLIEQNASLLVSGEEMMKTNYDLLSQNHAMIAGMEKYRVEARNKNRIINELELKFKNYKDYGYYARYDIYGEYSEDGSNINSTELSELMRQLVREDGNKYRVTEDPSMLPLVDRVIKEYPNFPFGYFVKYSILGSNRDPEWIGYAKKAVAIFEITITIEGHDITHESCLNEVKGNLSLINE